ncbi:MAG: argininosuccinate lyase [Clostridiales bacterium]|jgi:argininosuccinate lyase|nr:argininosuccinate lyase [Clostridiales bacterium]
MKYRTGHFNKNIDPLAEEFNSSLSVDKRLYREDIEASLAHAEMLGQRGIIPPGDAEKIRNGLLSVKDDIESGALEIRDAEDIHMFVETELTKRIGTAGKRLHTARSRNDQVATDFKLHVRRLCGEICESLRALITAITAAAEKNTDAPMPGFTHLQKAQPITAAHHLMAYGEMFYRDLTRFRDCKKRLNILPLGSCALAGTTYPIDRDFVKTKLGFDGISNNTLDGVSDRDFVCEFIYSAANAMLHLSRLSEEIIIFSSDDYKYITVDEAHSTGSSIMPQKRNPDIAELIRGKTGRVYGDLTAVLTMMKALPLAYNKDLQEDKEPLFDAYDALSNSLKLAEKMISALTYNKKNMLKACGSGYINATAAADYLTSLKGIPFREAYEITGALVSYAASKNLPLDKLTLAEFNSFAKNAPDNAAKSDAYAAENDTKIPLFDSDIYQKIDIKNILLENSTPGGPSVKAVKQSIKDLKKRLKQVDY